MGTSLFGLKPKNTYQALLKTTANTAIDATLRTISDGLGNDTPLQLSLTDTQINSTLRVHTNNAELLDLEDVASNNRFNINRDVQKINLDFASNPGLGTTQVGAIRTYKDGVNLSDVMSFIKNGNIGIGTVTPSQKLDVVGIIKSSYISTPFIYTTGSDTLTLATQGGTSAVTIFPTTRNVLIQNGGTPTDAGYKLDVNGSTRVKGAGSTGATTSLLVQNSAGQELAQFRDDVFASISGTFRILDSLGNNAMIMYGDGLGGIKTLWVNGNLGVGVLGNDASARLQADSTTKGFLPPRMTTVQKNAIVTPAAGLIVYDSTINKLCVRTAAAWETITSI